MGLAKVIPMPGGVTVTERPYPEYNPIPDQFRDKARREVEQAAREIDSDAEGESLLAIKVLLASAFHGPNVKRIANLLGVPRKLIYPMSRRLRESGVWRGGKVYHSGWDDDETGGVALLCDVCVALGWLERVP